MNTTEKKTKKKRHLSLLAGNDVECKSSPGKTLDLALIPYFGASEIDLKKKLEKMSCKRQRKQDKNKKKKEGITENIHLRP